MYKEIGNYGILDSIRLAACNSEIKVCSCKFILSQFRTFPYFKKKMLKLYDFTENLVQHSSIKIIIAPNIPSSLWIWEVKNLSFPSWSLGIFFLFIIREWIMYTSPSLPDVAIAVNSNNGNVLSCVVVETVIN